MAEEASVSEEIVAPAERVWAMVSDVTQMGKWSPENEGATWLRGATGPQSGAQFQGVNRNGKKDVDEHRHDRRVRAPSLVQLPASRRSASRWPSGATSSRPPQPAAG